MTQHDEICIYCRGTAGSREHLMPRSLGGTLIGKFLCSECNTTLGRLDQYLGEESMVSLPRLVQTEKFEVKMSQINYVTFEGIEQVAFRIVNGPSTKLLPQVHLLREGDTLTKVHFILDRSNIEDFQAIIKRQIQNEFKDTSYEVVENLANLAVINHEGKKLRFRVPKASHIDAVKEILRDNHQTWFEDSSTHEEIKAKSPVVSGQLKIDLNLMDRAIGKIAFNMMAHVYGPSAVLDPSFDSARRFIRYGEDNDSLRMTLVEQDFLNIPPVPGSEHEVMFFPMVGSTAVVNLYNAFRFMVYFPEGRLPEGIEEITSWTFSGQRDNTFDAQGGQTLADILSRMGALE